MYLSTDTLTRTTTMSRLLKILLYAVVLFFLFLWISSTIKSCGAEKSNTDQTEVIADVDEPASSADDLFEEEGSESTSTSPSSTDNTTTTDNNIDYTEIDRVVENNTSPPDEIVSTTNTTTTRPASTPRTNVNSGNSRGKYMVMAGSYLVKDNAQRMERRLKDMGYNQADIVVFDLSQYHSVVAARYSSYDSALRTSNELKRKGVDCYVHAQQN